jgi:hypothetical protein
MNMRHALSVFSDILTLRDATYHALKRSPGAPAFIILMFLIVTLLAGCGKWLGLPYELNRPTLVDQIGLASAAVEEFDEEVVPDIEASIATLSSDNLADALEEVAPPGVLASPQALAEAANQAGLRTSQLLDLVSAEVSIPDALRSDLTGQAVSTRVIDRLLAGTNLDAEGLRGILARQRLDALPGAVAAEGGIVNQLGAILLSGITSSGDLRSLVTELALSPERIRDLIAGAGLSAEELSRIDERIEAVPDQVQDVLAIAREEAVALQPPLGVTFSRLITFLGDWLATPLHVAVSYFPLVLVALLAAKMLGGKGTIVQHVLGMALAIAPAFLLFFTFTGDLGPEATSFEYALNVIGRVLSLIAIAWAVAILIKSLAVAHEFSYWRAAGTLALAYGILYVAVPVLSFLAGGYLLRG